MKLISSSPFTNNHSLSSHLALFLSHLLRKYVYLMRQIQNWLTKPPSTKKFTHTQTLIIVTLSTNIWTLARAAAPEILLPELPTPSNKSILATEMPNSYLLFSKLEYLDFLMTDILFFSFLDVLLIIWLSYSLFQ